MAFKLKTYKELASMTNEAMDENLLPLRMRAAKAKAESVKINLEEEMLILEAQINTLCAAKDPDFAKIADHLDWYDLTERRLKQVAELVVALFPEG